MWLTYKARWHGILIAKTYDISKPEAHVPRSSPEFTAIAYCKNCKMAIKSNDLDEMLNVNEYFINISANTKLKYP